MKSITHSPLKTALFAAFALTCVAPLSQVKAQPGPLVLTEVNSTPTGLIPSFGSIMDPGSIPDHWIWTAPPGMTLNSYPQNDNWIEPAASGTFNVVSFFSTNQLQIVSDRTSVPGNQLPNGGTDNYQFIITATGTTIDGLTYVDQAVETPEPSTLTLLGGAFVLLGALGRKLRE